MKNFDKPENSVKSVQSSLMFTVIHVEHANRGNTNVIQLKLNVLRAVNTAIRRQTVHK